MPKIQETKGRYWITIPKEIIEKKRLKKGQTILISINEKGNLELK